VNISHGMCRSPTIQQTVAVTLKHTYDYVPVGLYNSNSLSITQFPETPVTSTQA